MTDSNRRPLLLFLVTEDWYFCSHRLPIARAARDAGFRVAVATRIDRHGEAIRAEGFDLHPLPWRRRSLNPFNQALLVLRIAALYRRLRPTLVHHVAIKPVVLGSLAARLAGVPQVVNALAGLGLVFSDRNRKTRWLKPVLSALLRIALGSRSAVLLAQNPDDVATLRAAGVLAPDADVAVIRGSGIDTAQFRPVPEPCEGPLEAALVARMLVPKGVPVFAAAATILRARGVNVVLRLVGAPDPGNPASLDTTQLRDWVAQGVLRWEGGVSDVRTVWARAAIAVLPSSYGEGLPKSLLEAAACGRPLIATDIPGCREIVIDGVTGLRVPPDDPSALADAIARLAADPGLRQRLGAAARLLVESELSDAVVAAATLDLYRRRLGDAYPPPPDASARSASANTMPS